LLHGCNAELSIANPITGIADDSACTASGEAIGAPP
jgi:hypothetical protein